MKDALDALQQRATDGDVVSREKIARRTQALEKGRAVVSVAAATEAKARKVEQHREDITPHVQACLYNGVSTLQGVADCLNSKGQTTSRGGKWNPTTVRRLMITLGLSFGTVQRAMRG
ncbi:hypothetical protein D3C85_1497100 [compost metagenome]